jgi:hypothetical protein
MCVVGSQTPVARGWRPSGEFFVCLGGQASLWNACAALTKEMSGFPGRQAPLPSYLGYAPALEGEGRCRRAFGGRRARWRNRVGRLATAWSASGVFWRAHGAESVGALQSHEQVRRALWGAFAVHGAPLRYADSQGAVILF